MPKNAGKNYDVIIIGAGISGLVCGCYLARAGMKVLLLEQHNKPGGYCTSFNRHGLTFDAAAHSFGSYREGGNFRQILMDLGIDKLVAIARFNPSDTIVTPDFKINFWNDVKETKVELKKLFSGQQENIEKYFDFYDNLMIEDHFSDVKLRNKTYGSLLSSFFTDNRLMNAISVPVLGNGGLPPSLIHAFTGTKIFREFLIDGGYYPEGGMQTLPNALETVLKEHKGVIQYRKLAKKIACINNQVIGVELENNLFFASKYVVSACDGIQTYKSLLREEVTAEQIGSVLAMKPSMSTFTLYIGIDRPFDGLPREGTNIWYVPHYDLDKIYSDINDGNLASFGGGGFMFRVSPDKKTILAFCGAPFQTKSYWSKYKKEIAEQFLKRLEQLMPGLKEHIVHLEAATPHTLYRYTLNHEGANYGWAPLPSQLFDPNFRQKSFIKGLYLTGHWTCQTHGIPGVAYLGGRTAKMILQKQNLA